MNQRPGARRGFRFFIQNPIDQTFLATSAEYRSVIVLLRLCIKPPTILPLVGCDSERFVGFMTIHHVLITVKHRHKISATFCARRSRPSLFTAGNLGGFLPNTSAALLHSLSKALPTVGFAPQPEVVSDSLHFVDTHSSPTPAFFFHGVIRKLGCKIP
jgi:hypothetical protein